MAMLVIESGYKVYYERIDGDLEKPYLVFFRLKLISFPLISCWSRQRSSGRRIWRAQASPSTKSSQAGQRRQA